MDLSTAACENLQRADAGTAHIQIETFLGPIEPILRAFAGTRNSAHEAHWQASRQNIEIVVVESAKAVDPHDAGASFHVSTLTAGRFADIADDQVHVPQRGLGRNQERAKAALADEDV